MQEAGSGHWYLRGRVCFDRSSGTRGQKKGIKTHPLSMAATVPLPRLCLLTPHSNRALFIQLQTTGGETGSEKVEWPAYPSQNQRLAKTPIWIVPTSDLFLVVSYLKSSLKGREGCVFQKNTRSKNAGEMYQVCLEHK